MKKKLITQSNKIPATTAAVIRLVNQFGKKAHNRDASEIMIGPN